MFQQRPHKSLALQLAEADLARQGIASDFNSLNTALSVYGFRLAETERLSFTQR